MKLQLLQDFKSHKIKFKTFDSGQFEINAIDFCLIAVKVTLHVLRQILIFSLNGLPITRISINTQTIDIKKR